jgi:hypothetical protein
VYAVAYKTFKRTKNSLLFSLRSTFACETNITFMSLSGDVQPHFTAIASFVARMKDQLKPLFTQVLMICNKEGLIGRNMFAIHGIKALVNPFTSTSNYTASTGMGLSR